MGSGEVGGEVGGVSGCIKVLILASKPSLHKIKQLYIDTNNMKGVPLHHLIPHLARTTGPSLMVCYPIKCQVQAIHKDTLHISHENVS